MPAEEIKLRRTEPYWYEFKTWTKLRWFGREALEVFATEFRDRSEEYYRHALETGTVTINGKVANVDTVLKDGDLIVNSIHRHEPPVTADSIRILYRNDDEGLLVVVKPGSLPVHPTGRYMKHSLLELIKEEHGIKTVYTSNRLDRLTSGVMVCATKKETAAKLGEAFNEGKVYKEYVCRAAGKFPEEEIRCQEPLLVIDRSMGLTIVHPAGRPSETIFNRLSYDERTDSSVIRCRPITGRTHQIRVHLLHLGHAIVNDPIYNHAAWSKFRHSDSVPRPPQTPSPLSGAASPPAAESSSSPRTPPSPTLRLDYLGPTETTTRTANGPVEIPLDAAAVIHALRSSREEAEGWRRWRDMVMFGKANAERELNGGSDEANVITTTALREEGASENKDGDGQEEPSRGAGNNVGADGSYRADTPFGMRAQREAIGHCEECKIPLLPDPKPSELFIYLHAIKYALPGHWSFEDELPSWAREGWIPPKGTEGLTVSDVEGDT